jgi:hypothetical protein
MKRKILKKLFWALGVSLVFACATHAGSLADDMKRLVRAVDDTNVYNSPEEIGPKDITVSRALAVARAGLASSKAKGSWYPYEKMDEVIFNLEAILALPNLNLQIKEQVQKLLDESYAWILQGAAAE